MKEKKSLGQTVSLAWCIHQEESGGQNLNVILHISYTVSCRFDAHAHETYFLHCGLSIVRLCQCIVTLYEAT